MDFQDAEYIAPAGGPGRDAAPNPYVTTGVIQSIALKTDANGKPVAKATVVEHTDPSTDDGADLKKVTAKHKRLMSEAGEVTDPPVTVKSIFEPVTNPVNSKVSATKTKVTFWTIARQKRPRSTTLAAAEVTASE